MNAVVSLERQMRDCSPISYVKIRIADFSSTFEPSSYNLPTGHDILCNVSAGFARVNSEECVTNNDLLNEKVVNINGRGSS